MSHPRLSRSLLMAPMLAAALAGSAQAATTFTPLGTCTAPKPPNVALEKLGVTNPVTLTAAGIPRGQVGVAVRTNASLNPSVGAIDLSISIFDTSGNAFIGSISDATGGCVRALFPLSDAYNPRTGKPMVLKHNHLYQVKASAGYQLYEGYIDPVTAQIISLSWPTEYFWVQ